MLAMLYSTFWTNNLIYHLNKQIKLRNISPF